MDTDRGWRSRRRRKPKKAKVTRTLATTVWPSGLRRWLKAPVRKGVGSNPTAVILATNLFFNVLFASGFRLHSAWLLPLRSFFFFFHLPYSSWPPFQAPCPCRGGAEELRGPARAAWTPRSTSRSLRSALQQGIHTGDAQRRGGVPVENLSWARAHPERSLAS